MFSTRLDWMLGKLGQGAIPGWLPCRSLFLALILCSNFLWFWIVFPLLSLGKILCSPIQAAWHIPIPTPKHTVLNWP